MADFATYNDRRSAMRRLWTPLPDPDGTLDQADAQHVMWEYRGLLIDVTEPADFEAYRATAALRNAYGATVEA